MSVIIMHLFDGLSLSSILLMVALGLAITFGLMNVINMAHGEFIMLGAYTAYLIQSAFLKWLPESLFNWYFVLAIPLSFLLTAALGWLLEVSLVKHLYGRPLDSLIVTWGVSLMLQQAARFIFGAQNVGVKSPTWLDGGWEVLSGVIFTYKRLFILALVMFTIASVYYYLYHTIRGRRMRAVMQNREMAACLGISTRRVDASTFAIGSGIAGIAGCALSLLGPIGPTIGTYYIVDAFMVVVLGGIGKLVGTVAGALGIGMFNTLFEYSTSASIGKVLVFVLIIAFLQWRPSGFASMKTRALD